MKVSSVRVTDHAVLRYLERIGGFEIEKLRQEIAARVAQSVTRGQHTVLIDGHRFVLKEASNNTAGLVVATVLEAGDRSLVWTDRK
jgi:hypothetical protein